MTNKLRVLILSSNPSLLDEMTMLLSFSQSWHVQYTTNFDEMGDLIKTQCVDVAILHASLVARTRNGLDVILELMELHVRFIVLIINREERHLLVDAFALGIGNAIFEESLGDLREILYGVQSGQTEIHTDSAAILREAIIQNRTREFERSLTAMEKRVLYHLYEGHTKRQISELLYLEIRTVKFHIQNLIKKLGGATGKEAAVNARRKGYFRLLNMNTVAGDSKNSDLPKH